MSASSKVRRIDLTHRLRDGMPVWPTHPPFKQEQVSFFERGDVACLCALNLSEHTGTHFDAPLHFVPGGQPICDVPLERFFGRMLTIDARNAPVDSRIGLEWLTRFEKANGPVREGDAVFFSFGWARYFPTADPRFFRDWPGLSRELCENLVERRVSIVGTDCMSVENFSNVDFVAHHTLLRAGILIGENFNNLDQVPPVCSLIALPLPIEGGSGSPMRAVALVEH
jgi:kynurenine formamidase